MALTLLRPYVLSYKNRLITRKQGIFNREMIALVLSAGLVLIIYVVNLAFLQSIMRHPAYSPAILENLLRLFLIGFFFLLLFSNLIVALSSLFLTQDISLLLTAPISTARIFIAKLIEITFTSSWIFFLFATPVCFAYKEALGLPLSFLLVAFLAILPFVIIPAALAMIAVTLFVNVIPPYRMRDLLVVVAFLASGLMLFFGHNSPEYLPTEEHKMNELMTFLGSYHDPQPIWVPTRWITDLLAAYTGARPVSAGLSAALLIASTLGTVALAFLVFDTMFQRGLSVSSQGAKQSKIYSSDFSSLLGRALVPFQPQFRALFYKEARMFIRDTTQALQLMMLLLLTFMYLYNFRALRSASHFSEEGLVWWQVILSLSNVVFGACVVAAIATRFVFPSVSLEGRAFSLLRATPISLEQYLRYKFFTWLGPMTALALVLLVSGTLAIQGTPQTIIATVAVAWAIAIGVTGLGVGSGAYYARFDWESPAQVTASFGSLVFMLLALTNILFSTIPMLFIFILTSVPDFAAQMSDQQYFICLVASLLLLFTLNVLAARHALNAGANALRERD